MIVQKLKTKKNVIIFSFLFFILSSVFFIGGCDKNLENQIYDKMVRLKGEQKISNDILIVNVDDISLEALQQKWPLSRTIFAEALKNLSQYQPKVIGFDFIFSGTKTVEEDNSFKNSISEIKDKIPVILAMSYDTKKNKQKLGGQKITSIDVIYQYPYFQNDFGFVNVYLDEDDIIRRTHLVKEFNNKRVYSFPFEVAKKVLKISDQNIQYRKNNKIAFNGKTIALDKYDSALINYAGPQGTFKSISFVQAYKNLLNKDLIKDKIVLIGPKLAQVNDVQKTPFTYYKGVAAKTSGVEILANIINNIIQHNFLERSSFFSVFLILFFIFVINLSIYFIQFKNSLKIYLSLIIAIFFILFFLVQFFAFNIIYNFTIPFLLAVIFVVAQVFSVKKALRVSKQSNMLIPQIFSDKFNISNREAEIIDLVLKEKSNEQIGKKLFISLSTVKNHVYNIFQKTKMKKRKELIDLLKKYQEK